MSQGLTFPLTRRAASCWDTNKTFTKHVSQGMQREGSIGDTKSTHLFFKYFFLIIFLTFFFPPRTSTLTEAGCQTAPCNRGNTNWMVKEGGNRDKPGCDGAQGDSQLKLLPATGVDTCCCLVIWSQRPLLHTPQHNQKTQKGFISISGASISSVYIDPFFFPFLFFLFFSFFVLVLPINVYHSPKQCLDAGARERPRRLTKASAQPRTALTGVTFPWFSSGNIPDTWTDQPWMLHSCFRPHHSCPLTPLPELGISNTL